MTAETASYDVFDTVVTRTFAGPRDLFAHVGTLARRRGLLTLEPRAFGEARWASELAARKLSPWTEVLLDDIYATLASRLGWDAATTAAIKALELETESRHLRGIPRTRAALAADRARCGRLLFLSDMYLPSAVLRPWLEREGVCAPGDELFISGEARGNKSSGELFAAAQRATGGNLSRWHHMSATHFTAAHLTPREKLARGSDGEFATTWRSLLAGAMRLARLERTPASPREERLWAAAANVAGPLFYGFVRWTLASARQRGLRRLYFLARDGQIFLRIARELQANDADPIECHYLQGSRLVFAGPAELQDSEAFSSLAVPNASFHSLHQTLSQLGLEEAEVRPLLPSGLAALPLDENMAPAVRGELVAWLLAPERRTWLRAALARRADTARAYLASIGLRAGEPAGLVDTGWLGSMQRNLEILLGTPGQPRPLVGFYLGLLPPQPPAVAGERIGYANTFAPLPLVREESHKVLIELMAQSDQGQVVGFTRDGDHWTPVRNDPGPVNLAEIRLFQEAILCFVRRANEVADELVAPEDEFARVVLALYRDLHDHPTPEEARLFGFMPHADQLFEQCHAGLCAQMSLGEVLAALRNYRLRPPHWWIQGQATLGSGALLRSFHFLKQAWWRLKGRAE
jgi:hypothetical protein